MRKIILFIALSLFGCKVFAQLPTNAFEIQSILADACTHNNTEGYNEMVRFRVGPNPITGVAGAAAVNNLKVKWANGIVPWQGTVLSPSKTAALNSSIISSCGLILEPAGGVLPAYATVMLIASSKMDPTATSFANLMDTIYVLYASYDTTTGHFLNYNAVSQIKTTYLRTTTPAYADTVKYDPSLLSTLDGATINYDFDGNATYVNIGCDAPFAPPIVSAAIVMDLDGTIIPLGASFCSGGTLTFTASPTNGGATPTYQWQLNGVNIPFATDTFYSSNSLNENDTITLFMTSSLSCVISNQYTSPPIIIKHDVVPTINSQPPANQTVCDGSSASFTVAAIGTGLSYQWQLSTNGGSIWNNLTLLSPYNGVTTNTLSVNPVSNSQHNYQFRCVITGSCSPAATTIAATLLISPSPVITLEPLDKSVCTGKATSFTIGATGTSLSYRWKYSIDGGLTWANVTTASGIYSGTTQTTLNASSVDSSMNNYQYMCVVSSSCTSLKDTSVVVILTVNALPTVNAGVDRAVCAGTQVTLSGTGASSYLWNNGVINGTLFTPLATTTYTVTGTDVNGCSNTDQVVVVKNALPAVSAGNDQALCAGSSITLSGSGASSYSWNNGVINGTPFTPNTTITYTVTGTDVNSCTNTDQIIVTVNALPTVNAGIDQIVCAGTLVTLSGSGATSYQWNNGVTNGAPFTPAITTTYTVTGTIGSCSNTDQVIVNVNTVPNANAGTDQTIPNGTNTTLAGSATGGSGLYSYLWAPSGSLTDPANQFPTTVNLSSSTTFSLTVTDTNTGCTATDQVSVNVSGGVLSTTASANPSALCAGASSQLTANPSGGSGSYTFSWSSLPVGFTSGSANPTVSPASNTTYTITVNDGFNIATSSVVVIVNSLPSVSAGVDQTVCGGSSVILSGSGANSYVWSNGVINGSPFTPLVGSITYSVTGTNSNGCTNTDQVIVTVNAQPIVNAGVDQTISNGTSTTLAGSASSGSGSYSYLWTPSISLINPTNQNPATVNLSSSTTFTLSVTDMVSGCTATDQVIVNIIGGTLSATTTATPSSICVGVSTQIVANANGGSGSYTYSWSSSPVGFSSGASGATVSPAITTTYTVTINDGFNTAVSSIMVVVNPLPTASISATLANICAGQSTTLTANGGGTYNWSTGSTNSMVIVTPVVATTYTVTVNVNGCTDTQDIIIHVDPAITAISSPSTICVGANCILSCSGGATYLWSNGATTQSTTVAPIVTTTYYVTATSNTCTATTTAVVVVNPLPLANAGNDQSICSGTSATLTASGGSSYIWDVGGNTASVNVSPLVNTTYLVTVSVGSCSATDAVAVAVNPMPTANAGVDQTLCSSQSVIITASGGGTYSWVSSPAGYTSTNSSNSVSPTVTTTYTVVVSMGFCTASDAVIVVVNPTPTANAGIDQAICSGQSATITATGGGAYSWVSSPSGFTSVNASNIVLPIVTTTYSVIITSSGCTASDAIIVSVNATPIANAGIDQSVCSGQPTTITATGGGAYSWTSIPAGFISTNVSNSVSPITITTYTVTVTELGCTASDAIIITALSKPNANIGLDKTICAGDTVLLIATGGGTYHWSNGTSENSILAKPIVATTYSVTITNVSGCSASDNITLFVNVKPLISLTTTPDSNLIYLGESVSISANPSTFSSYEFFTGNSSLQTGVSPNYLLSSATDNQQIYATATDQFGCKSSKDSIKIKVRPISNAFTPDGDNKNDIFMKGVDLTIVNRWGQQLYHGQDGWDGKYKGAKMSPGTYFFIVKLIDFDGNEIKTETGVVNLVGK